MAVHQKPELRIRQFEGPLDLLFHLIEKNDVDIYDIPIFEITTQYMEFLQEMKSLYMEVASEFLVMAATLVHIKSRIMLPDRRKEASDEEEDPREELVISLLRYKRCKLMAGELKNRYMVFSDCRYRIPSTAASLGVVVENPPQEFTMENFNEAVDSICQRNEMRFADVSSKITNILKREKFSVKEKMKFVWRLITQRGKIFFHELFLKNETSNSDKIAAFLAILELLRSNRISAEQKKPFDSILLEEKRTA